MSLFRRRLMMSCKGITIINPYIKDGLIAMWDGEWNAGLGRHDALSTSWIDLSGNGHDMTLNRASWDTNSFLASESPHIYATIPSAFNFMTCEIVLKIDSLVNTSSYEVDVLNGMKSLGFYVQYCTGNTILFFNDRSGSPARNYRYCIHTGDTEGVIGKKFSSQYVADSLTAGNKVIVLARYNGVNKDLYQNGSGINQVGVGLNKRSDRRFSGRVYSLRLYDRALTEVEMDYNLSIDNERFNLELNS